MPFWYARYCLSGLRKVKIFVLIEHTSSLHCSCADLPTRCHTGGQLSTFQPSRRGCRKASVRIMRHRLPSFRPRATWELSVLQLPNGPGDLDHPPPRHQGPSQQESTYLRSWAGSHCVSAEPCLAGQEHHSSACSCSPNLRGRTQSQHVWQQPHKAAAPLITPSSTARCVNKQRC